MSALMLPGPERRAAAAERRAEHALQLEREPAVCIAERRRWGMLGEWR